MTLIEVLAGLVVLGTVLASITIVRGRFMRQAGRAHQKIEAVRQADELISTWLSGPPEAIPVPSQGSLQATSKLFWRTAWRPDRAVESLGARIVRLDIVDRTSPGVDPALSVEFVVRDLRQRGSPSSQPAGKP
jgi:type II secretory pathway pseudopilin PulG